MNFTDTNYKHIPEDNECCINAVQIGKRIGEPPHTIRTWADLYEQYMYIKKINGRFVYTEASVSQFMFIKTMIREKGFNHRQIENQIIKHGFNYTVGDGDIIDQETLELTISQSNEKFIKQFIGTFIQEQEKSNRMQMEIYKNEMAITIQEIIENEMYSIKNDLNSDISEKLESMFDTIKSELSSTKDELVTTLRKSLDDKHKVEEYDKVKKKRFIDIIFHKKN